MSPLHADQRLHDSLPCAEQSLHCSHPCAEKIWTDFARHMDVNNANFSPHMEGSHTDFAPHMKWIRCTLRSGLHEIPTMIRTFPHRLENNHACKWISDNFPGMLTYVLFLENCLKSICMHGCSPIHVERSFFFLKVWDRFVP